MDDDGYSTVLESAVVGQVVTGEQGAVFLQRLEHGFGFGDFVCASPVDAREFDGVGRTVVFQLVIGVILISQLAVGAFSVFLQSQATTMGGISPPAGQPITYRGRPQRISEVGQASDYLATTRTTTVQMHTVQREMGIPLAVLIQGDVLSPGLVRVAAQAPGVFRFEPFNLARTVFDQNEIAIGVLVDAAVFAFQARLYAHQR
ncbi:hypothetical protein D3C80_749940 [compost metagenome]